MHSEIRNTIGCIRQKILINNSKNDKLRMIISERMDETSNTIIYAFGDHDSGINPNDLQDFVIRKKEQLKP